MRGPTLRIATGAAGAVLAGLLAASTPEPAPRLDPATTSPLLVIAKLRPGHYLAQFEECGRADTICMDPPPFRFKANVIATVFGERPPSRIQPATTSHYGMSSIELAQGAQLLLLHGDGRDYIMLRYARAGLTKNRAGDYFLLMGRPTPPWWLPCSVASLREELRVSDFSRDQWISPKEYEQHDEDEKQGLVLQPDGSAFPRYGISMARLGEHLRELRPGVKEMRCEHEPATGSS